MIETLSTIVEDSLIVSRYRLNASCLGPRKLDGSAPFDLFLIHAEAGELKKISDLGVWSVWSPKVITFWEALFMVLRYGLLLLDAYAQDKHWPFISIPLERSERPAEASPHKIGNNLSFQYENDVDKETADIFSAIANITCSLTADYSTLNLFDVVDCVMTTCYYVIEVADDLCL
ncbi:hypothetical protein QVD17_24348 [Tagetes erecta]|uniref:Uncharacterized protein n=1 Tax=Tagetes erecta TaxID=13708 RepID=A0AAD8KLG3_TARER|nr:hypothetical protein QVD17_24348 [Tagetes erecta]